MIVIKNFKCVLRKKIICEDQKLLDKESVIQNYRRIFRGLSEAEYPLVFFSIDWTVTRISYDANSAIAMVATSLACIATA